MKHRAIGKCVALALACGFASATGAWAQQARIGIYVDNGVQSSCDVSLIVGIHSLTIRLDGTVAPVKTARFKLLSSCPLTYFGTPPNLEYDLTFGSCIGAGAQIENFGILVQGSTQVCTIKVVPVTGATNIELTDCDGVPMVGGWSHDGVFCVYTGNYVAPYRPDPPNGAVNVPINTLLSYVGPANLVNLATYPFLFIEDAYPICTSQAGSQLPLCTLPIDPGLLQPNTTYYWRAYNTCFGCTHGEGAGSELFSFTTGGPVAVEHSTWGHVKALYRE